MHSLVGAQRHTPLADAFAPRRSDGSVLAGIGGSGGDADLFGRWRRPPTVVVPFHLCHEYGTVEGKAFLGTEASLPRPAVLVNLGCYAGLAAAMALEAPLYNKRGYAYVLALSSGSIEEVVDHMFFRWQADAEALLDWIGEQHWCDGRVVTHGVSLVGNTAYAAVQASVPRLRHTPRAALCSSPRPPPLQLPSPRKQTPLPSPRLMLTTWQLLLARCRMLGKGRAQGKDAGDVLLEEAELAQVEKVAEVAEVEEEDSDAEEARFELEDRLAAESRRPRVVAAFTIVTFSRIQPTVFLWGQGLAVETILRFLWLAEVAMRDGALTGLGWAKAICGFFTLWEWPGLLDAAAERPLWDADMSLWQRSNVLWRGGLQATGPSDAFWQGGRDMQCDLAALGDDCPPIHIVTGWWDIFVNQSLDDFHHVLINRRKRGGARLTILAAGHFAVAAAPWLPKAILAWYDEHLTGRPPPGPAPDNVRVELYGGRAGELVDCGDTWPPEVWTWLELYAEAPELPDRIGALRTRPPPTASPACAGKMSFVYDPRTPTPYAGGGWLNFRREGAKPQDSIEARADVLVLTSPRLAAPVDLLGVASAVLFVSSSSAESDFVARLCVVRAPKGLQRLGLTRRVSGIAAGTSFNLCESVVRVNLGEAEDMAGQDRARGWCRVEFRLGALGCRLFAGDRLRLQVCSAAHPRILRHPLVPNWLMGDGELGAPAHQVLFADAARASCIRLPCLSAVQFHET